MSLLNCVPGIPFCLCVLPIIAKHLMRLHAFPRFCLVLCCVLLQLKGKVCFVYLLKLNTHLLPLCLLLLCHIKLFACFFSFFYFKPLVTPLFIQSFCNNIQVISKNRGEDLMKKVQFLYNNNINNFLYSWIKETNI